MQRAVLPLLVFVTLGAILFFVAMIWLSAVPPEGEGAAPTAAGDARATGGQPVFVSAPSGLAIPVVGVAPADLIDTYRQDRDGGARAHNAIDIMAPAGTPVIAVADGMVEKLYYSEGGGGISAYVRSNDDQWIHYYAHLQAYAPGLAEGQRLRRGDPVGLVGSTGNANEAGPHLHFAIHAMGPGEAWHEGTPINPYPLLAGQASAR